ncbi:hypothetical protein V6N13_135289 [Hibiscus sabdariffa]|uniref:NADP-dependent oxidoreductase domain-containing protein n=1 Tax=Hibiscus sabdariffa TaxID=183260 RepID=A0ABR2R6D5_9ROSI
MEALVESGLVRAIGVSNFSVHQIKELLNFTKIVPAVNQRQDELVKFCQSKGIHVSAHTPLGVPTSSPGVSDSGSGGEDEPETHRISFRRSRSVHGPMLKLSIVGEIVDRHQKTPEQITSNCQLLPIPYTGFSVSYPFLFHFVETPYEELIHGMALQSGQ